VLPQFTRHLAVEQLECNVLTLVWGLSFLTAAVLHFPSLPVTCLVAHTKQTINIRRSLSSCLALTRSGVCRSLPRPLCKSFSLCSSLFVIWRYSNWFMYREKSKTDNKSKRSTN